MADSLNPHYLARKLHSLTGLLPVGGFLGFHLWENSMARKGQTFFNHHVVGGIEDMLNYKVLVEGALLGAILFHGVYGVIVWLQGKSNTARFHYCSNIRYLLQRITAFTTLIFIGWHVWETRIAAEFDPAIAKDLFSHMQQIYENPVNVALYVAGITGATFHLANGVWLIGINWGITTHPRSQKISSWIMAAVFIGLTFLGMHAIWGFGHPQTL